MALDPKLVRIFIVVAEELSFSRAAIRMNVAQPWVSERLRRLEEQLGFRLLNRTSRSVELTPDGAAFLPRAVAISDAIAAAEGAARELQGTGAKRFRLASLDSYLTCPERRILIDRFIHSNPSFRFDIRWGSIEAVLPMLFNGETDIVFGSRNMIPDDPALEVLPFCVRQPVLIVPDENPLSQLESIDIHALSGQKIAVSPGHSNPYAVNTTLAPLREAGAELIPAPESLRATVEHFARSRRMMCIRWCIALPDNRKLGDRVLVPISGSPIAVITALWRKRGQSSPGALAFWRSAEVLKRTLSAGDADPNFRAIKEELEHPASDLG